MNSQTTEIIATDNQATDEAVLMLTRRLRRLHPEVFAAVVGSLSQGLQDALHLADNRADSLRHHDKRDGITRTFQTIAERTDAEMAAEGIDED